MKGRTVQKRSAHIVLAAAVLFASVETVLGDWKSDIARRAIGSAARAGIRNAVQDAVADAAFDAAMSAVQQVAVPTAGVNQLPPPVDSGVPVTSDVYPLNPAGVYAPGGTEVVAFGSTAGAAVEAAMIAADVADAIDTAQNVANAARTVKKVSDVARAIKSIRR